MAYLDNVTNILQIQPDGLPTVVRLSQNEDGRRLYFRLVGNEDPIPSGVTVTISGTKPDGVVYSATGSITNDVVLINENTQMTAVAGTWDAKIKIVSSGQTIATGRVRFEIDADTVAPGSVPSDSELEGLIAEAQAYAENARSAAYGSPLTASTVAGMTDQTRVYVYTGSETGYTSGHWYYWNGTAWTDGGTYNSIAVQTDTTLAIPGMAADAKVTGDELASVKSDLNDIEEEIGIILVETTASTEYNDDAPTGTAISTTQRWFLNGFAYGRIDTVSIRFRLAGGATVEIWEKNGDVLNRIHTESVSCDSNYTWKTFTISGVESDYPMMVSIISDTTNGICSITNTSKDFNAKYISPSSTPPLSYSALNTFAGLNVTAYVTYTYYAKLRHRGYLTVSKTSGFDYTNIADAVTNANDGDTILVYPGTYTEPIEAWGKTIDIIGIDKNTCIITNDTGNYSTPAVEIDSGRIANFTIISTGANPTCDASDVNNYMHDYCIHADNIHAEGKTLIVENCIIRNTHRAALGIGGYQDYTMIVRNCDIWSGAPPQDISNPLWNKRGVLYFHNRQPSAFFAHVTGQKLRFINNTMYCDDIIALYIGDTCNGVDMDGNGWTNEMEVEFINNMLCGKYANGTYKTTSNGLATPTAFTNDSIISGTGFSQYLKLSTISYGNNVAYLNA